MPWGLCLLSQVAGELGHLCEGELSLREEWSCSVIMLS